MKAIRIVPTGGPGVMKLEELVDPRPGEDEAGVRIEAIGVNFIDGYAEVSPAECGDGLRTQRDRSRSTSTARWRTRSRPAR